MFKKSLDAQKFPRCPECGGDVQLVARRGRTREYLRGVFLPIPKDFGIPTCTRCGEESMSADISEKLDAHLSEALRQLLNAHVATVRERHGVTQRDIEDALRVTRSYLSHLLSGRKPPSGTLVEMLALFAEVPGAFAHALGRPATTEAKKLAPLDAAYRTGDPHYVTKRSWGDAEALPTPVRASCAEFSNAEFDDRRSSSTPPLMAQA
jgi:transcriptional regulator with XRE-family HTH domain